MIEAIRQELNLCETENGDTAYRSTFNANLDLFGTEGALRGDQESLIYLFDAAFSEDELLAIKNMLYLRDARSGLGERKSFRTVFNRLIYLHKEAAVKLIPLIPEIGRYDDLLVCMDTPVEDDMVSFIDMKLKEDITNILRGNEISLLSKWLPSVNASNKETVRKARRLAEKLGMSERDYRRTLSFLRKGRIIENNLREKDYSFDYSSVPSVAMHKYRAAFVRNDEKRFFDFVEAVVRGEKKINAGRLYPYQIIKEAYGGMSEEEKMAMQVKWDTIKTESKASKTIVVRDGSGSMTCNFGNIVPLDVATSLAILFAEKLEGEFHNKFITFSSSPKLVELKGKDLYSKLVETSRYSDYTSTNINKVYELILKVVSRPNFKKEDMIERIVIISDMEFDQGTTGKPTFDVFKEKFEALGYRLPEVVFWNVASRRVHFASMPDQANIKLVSGCSSNIIDDVLNNGSLSAVEYMQSVLSRYDYVEEILTK